MDLSRRGLVIHDASSTSSSSQPGGFPPPPPPPHVSDQGFLIIAVALIGILAITFLLVGYYVFVIKCCLNWREVDVIGRFWVSRRNRRDDPLSVYSRPGVGTRGLDEAAIQSIPVRNFKGRGVGVGEKNGKTGEFSECAVCLDEFQEDEKVKIIPSCGHVFHMDCIDVWLQNNANCPLCRRSISSAVLFPVDAALAPRPSPDQSPDAMPGEATSGDEDFVVIELGGGTGGGQFSPKTSFRSIGITPRDSPLGSEQRADSLPRKGRRRTMFRKMTSMGDEFIDTKGVGRIEFPVQPMRRSISMDSSVDRTLLMAVREALRQQKWEVDEEEGCSNGNRNSNSNSKVCRSRPYFSFGHHGRVPRSSVQPLPSDDPP